jgi:hypothetical protein
LIGFKSDDELRLEAFREHEELLSESEPFMGEDWEDRALDGEFDKVNDGFMEYDPVFTLLGKGQRTNSTCGMFGRPQTKFLLGCLRLELHNRVTLDPERDKMYHNKVAVKRVFYTCHKPECPECYARGFALRAAKRGVYRLEYASNELGMKVEHFIASLSKEECLKLGYDALRKLMLKALFERGIVGGCYVYHHFRYHGKDETYFGEKPHWFVSPHFHILGFLHGGYNRCRFCAARRRKGWVGEGVCDNCNQFEAVTRRANKKDGFIVKVAEDKKGNAGERESIGATLWYELNHSCLKRDDKKHVVVNWFGKCGRNAKVIPKGKIPQFEHLCPICGEFMYKVRPKEGLLYADVLRMMAPFKNSHVFILDAKDAEGNWLWEIDFDEHKGG